MQEKKSTLEKLSTCFPLFSSLYLNGILQVKPKCKDFVTLVNLSEN